MGKGSCFTPNSQNENNMRLYPILPIEISRSIGIMVMID